VTTTRTAAVIVHLAAQRPQARGLRAEEPRRRGLAERDDHLRRDEVDLAVEEGRARRRLVEGRRAVAGRAALHHVGDVRIAPAPQARGRQHAVEEFPRLADERLALLILVGPRPSPTKSQGPCSAPTPKTACLRLDKGRTRHR
jgi:hypothetical protein